MRVKSLGFQIFSGFLLATAIIFIIISTTYRLGLSRAIDKWSRDVTNELEYIATTIITTGIVDDNNVPNEVPLFVYDREYNLLYSNRGGGKKNLENREYVSITIGDEIIGYYSTSRIDFMDNMANQQFTTAIDSAIRLAIIISTVVILILSLMMSKRVAHPTRSIINFIKGMEAGERGVSLNIEGPMELEKIAEVISVLNHQLQREAEIRRQWARDVAHDLRTPVSALKAQFEAMDSGVLDITKDRLQRNLKEVEAMEFLIEDLSELMRLEEPELKLIKDRVLTEELLSHFDTHNPVVQEKGLEVSIHCEVEELYCDEMVLGRALSNLWSNALRYSNSGGEIEILCNKEGDYSVISIRNSGEVIPKLELGKIFDRLYRGETARNSRGSGLGLSIVKRIVELHSGEISVSSSREKGTIFSITIPHNTI